MSQSDDQKGADRDHNKNQQEQGRVNSSRSIVLGHGCKEDHQKEKKSDWPRKCKCDDWHETDRRGKDAPLVPPYDIFEAIHLETTPQAWILTRRERIISEALPMLEPRKEISQYLEDSLGSPSCRGSE
jgi:hypothetical protein